MKTSKSMRLVLRAMLSTLLLFSPLSPAAQPAEETGQTETAAEPQDGEGSTDPAAEPASADGEGEGESGEVFIPSEEISEDFAVSFPVDI